MSRMGWAFVAALALIVGGLAIAGAAASPAGGFVGTAAFVFGCGLLAGLLFVAIWRGLRGPEFGYPWNPGAAYRAAKSEREALEHQEREVGDAGAEDHATGDGPGS